MLQRRQHFLRVPVRFHLRPDLFDAPVRPDEKGHAMRAQVFPAHEPLLRPATTNITPPNRAAQPLAGLPLRRPRGTLSETAALGAIRQRSRSELCLRRRESRAAHAERLPPCSSPRAGLRSRTEPRRCYRNRAGHRPRTRRRTTTPATPTRRPRLAYVPVPLLPEGRLMRWWWCACRTNPDQ